MNKHEPELFICTESRISLDITEAEISIQGYKSLRSNSPSRFSGGVVTYIRNDINASLIIDDVIGYDNIMVFDINNGTCRGRWFAIYHSPNASDCDFLERFERLFEMYSQAGRRTYVTGDFNINMKDRNPSNTYKNRLTRFENSTTMKQLVKKYTRVTRRSKSLIDLFFTNDETARV